MCVSSYASGGTTTPCCTVEPLTELALDTDEELELAALDELEEALLDAAELPALLELLDDEELEAADGSYEHQGVPLMEIAGNSDASQVNDPVSVAYTKVPDLPKATLWVPLIEQVAPAFTHLV